MVIRVCTHCLAGTSLLTNLSYFCLVEVYESVFGNFKCLVLFVGLTLLSASSSSSGVFFLYGPLVTWPNAMQIILLLPPHWPLVAHLTTVSAHHMAAALTNFTTPSGKVAQMRVLSQWMWTNPAEEKVKYWLENLLYTLSDYFSCLVFYSFWVRILIL